MKKYYICFFVLAVLLAAALLTGAYFYLYQPRKEGPVPNGVMESETVKEDNAVMNQQQVEKCAGNSPIETNKAKDERAKGAKQYCLVAENGFLFVFARDKRTVCLDTHMPLTEFPEAEQEKLTEGIWFSTMIEIFNYLESYSS